MLKKRSKATRRNPCKECIVTSMCLHPCNEFYLDTYATILGFTDGKYALTSPVEEICRFILRSIKGTMSTEVSIGLDDSNGRGICLKFDYSTKKMTLNRFRYHDGAIYETKSM